MASFRLRKGIQVGERPVPCEDSIPPGELPPCLILPVQGSSYDQSRALVAPGETVAAGQALSEPRGTLARVRLSPLKGRVAEVCLHPVLRAGLEDGGTPSRCRVLSVILEDLESPRQSPASLAWREAPVEELMARLEPMGLEGQGGLPLDYELAVLRDPGVLLLNAAELQRGQAVLDWLLNNRLPELEAGVEALAQCSGFREVVLTHLPRQKNVAGRFMALIEKVLPVKGIPLKEGYPAAHPMLLAARVLGRFPDPLRPLAAQGVLVMHLDRLSRVQQRVSRREYGAAQPVTVMRSEDDRARLFWALPGTPLNWLLKRADERQDLEVSAASGRNPRLVLAGGALDGAPLVEQEAPLLEGLRLLLDYPAASLPAHREDACISCGLCLDGCPVRLNPPNLVHLVQDRRLEEAQACGLETCIDCGICTWLCPGRLNLGHVLRKGQFMLREARDAC